ncbi:MAG: D-alanine--D-alanine ligase [Verrucomicrobia bacterium]|nr:D-alanine--D-alanine ligase [Verrucomicrobiota bacterium]
MFQKLSVTVMLGGPSAEWDVSLRSGAAVARALSSFGHSVHVLDPRNNNWSLLPGTQVVFLALHGAYGEDGTVQQRLDELGVPYTGSGPEASRLAFDKVLAKKHFIEAAVPTARYTVVRSVSAKWPEYWQPPMVVKPSRQGSSVGVQFVFSEADWPGALAEAFQFDNEILVEEKIEGREITVAILDNQALPIVEIRTKQGYYDYRNKYTSGASEYFCPASFDASTAGRIRETALNAFNCLGGRDYGRVDIIVKPDGSPVVLEVNTLPGMTETSLFPKAAAAVGMDFAAVCQKMLELAMRRAPQKL